jgi:hypothetical protein
MNPTAEVKTLLCNRWRLKSPQTVNDRVGDLIMGSCHIALRGGMKGGGC